MTETAWAAAVAGTLTGMRDRALASLRPWSSHSQHDAYLAGYTAGLQDRDCAVLRAGTETRRGITAAQALHCLGVCSGMHTTAAERWANAQIVLAYVEGDS